MLHRRALTFFAIIVIGLSASACTSTAWVTPLAPPRSARETNCRLRVTKGPAPEATTNLGIVRCDQRGLDDDCVDLVKAKACEIGGDVIYGLHWEESYRTSALVGTVGTSEAP